MKVFITGIAGFLGSHIADAMLADGHEVVGIDNMVGGELANVPVGAQFYLGECNDHVNVGRLMHNCDIVYHCAALAYEGLSVFSPHLVTQNIVGASVSVFSAACANRVRRIVHCSSMARYGAIETPYRENMTPRPQDPYGISKLCAEQMLQNLCTMHHVDYVIAVPHNIIGPRQKYDDPYRNVAAIMINKMLHEEQPVIYGDGYQQRCFSFIDDCLSCLVEMATSPSVVGQIVNIGPDEEPITINALAEYIADLLDFKLDPIRLPGRPAEVRVALCSSNKARRLLGYETKTTLHLGLQKMIDFIRTRGIKPFKYHLPIEIKTDKTPRTWTEKLI